MTSSTAIMRKPAKHNPIDVYTIIKNLPQNVTGTMLPYPILLLSPREMCLEVPIVNKVIRQNSADFSNTQVSRKQNEVAPNKMYLVGGGISQTSKNIPIQELITERDETKTYMINKKFANSYFFCSRDCSEVILEK